MERNADGSFNMLFGYFNRNREEVVDAPVGADNKFEPGDADRGSRRISIRFATAIGSGSAYRGFRLEKSSCRR